MRRLHHSLACAAVLLLASMLATAVGAAMQPLSPLRICMTDVPHHPWRQADADGRVRDRGLDFELIRAVERQHGVRVKLQLYSGRRCLLELQRGGSDATVGLSHTPERAGWLQFPMRNGQLDTALALRTDAYGLYARPGSAMQWDGQHLRMPPERRAVAAQSGHPVVQLLRDLGIAVDDHARSTEHVMRLVLRGDFEAAALPVSEAETLRRQQDELRAVVLVEPPLVVRHYFVVFATHFAKRHPEQLQPLWQAFDRAARFPAYQQAVRDARRTR